MNASVDAKDVLIHNKTTTRPSQGNHKQKRKTKMRQDKEREDNAKKKTKDE
jgi:hypothetical protein